MTRIRRHRIQPLATLAFAYGMARLWWFNRRASKARARRLGERCMTPRHRMTVIAALSILCWLPILGAARMIWGAC